MLYWHILMNKIGGSVFNVWVRGAGCGVRGTGDGGRGTGDGGRGMGDGG